MESSHISIRTRQDAVDNIEAKLAVLESWAKKGVPYIPVPPGPKRSPVEKRLDYFPTSKNAFCLWTAEDNCPRTVELYPQLLTIRSLSPETINQTEYYQLRERMEVVLKTLIQRKDAVSSVPHNSLELDELKSDRDRWRRIAEVQEVNVRELRERAAQEGEKFRAERRARLSNEKYLNEKITELSEQVATLTAAIKKVSGLKSAGKKS